MKCLDHNYLVRLDDDLNEFVDSQIYNLAREPGSNLSGINTAGVCMQFLDWELAQIPDALERLTLVGLLLRESMFLGNLSAAQLYSSVLDNQISHISSLKWLKPIRQELRFIIKRYIESGHIDGSGDLRLHQGMVRDTAWGYIISKDGMIFSGQQTPEEKKRWIAGLEFTCMFTRSRFSHMQWDLSDPQEVNEYAERAYRELQEYSDRQASAQNSPNQSETTSHQDPDADEHDLDWPSAFL